MRDLASLHAQSHLLTALVSEGDADLRTFRATIDIVAETWRIGVYVH
jgi:hypothetical protein